MTRLSQMLLLAAAANAQEQAACITMDVVFADTSSALHVYAGVGDPGACCRLCTARFGCAAFTAYASDPTPPGLQNKSSDATCNLFQNTDNEKPSVPNTVSGRVIKYPTHYSNPQTGPCAADESPRGWKAEGGTGQDLELCSKECDPKDPFPCPLDVPDGATGTPKCDLAGNAFPDLFCSMNCSHNSDCGPPETGAFCDTSESHSVCGYSKNGNGSHLPWTLPTPQYLGCVTRDITAGNAFDKLVVSFPAINAITGTPISLGIKTNEPIVCAQICRNGAFPYMATDNERCFCSYDLSSLPVVSDTSCNITCPGDPSSTCGGEDPTSKKYYVSYYNISTLPPPPTARATVETTGKAHAGSNVCIAAPGIIFTGKPIEVIEDAANPDACCALCDLSQNCSAWTSSLVAASSSTCSLFDTTVGQASSEGTKSTSGYMRYALTHFRNPRSSQCKSDEEEYAIKDTGFSATWCSAQCSSDADCPIDVPTGTTATPQCLLQEPFGSMKRCVLACAGQNDCGTGQDTLCSKVAGTSFCTYTNEETPQSIDGPSGHPLPRFLGSFKDGVSVSLIPARNFNVEFCSAGTQATNCKDDSRIHTGFGNNAWGGSGAMNPRLCARMCDGFKYAGIQAGYACFCGNETYGVFGHEDFSQGLPIVCPGDPAINCGGVSVNDIYALTSEIQMNQCATTKEKTELTVACERGSSMVFTAASLVAFGTSQATMWKEQCSPHHEPPCGTSNSTQAYAYVEEQCLGKSSCTLDATEANLGSPGNPCTGPLFLTVNLSCAVAPLCSSPAV